MRHNSEISEMVTKGWKPSVAYIFDRNFQYFSEPLALKLEKGNFSVLKINIRKWYSSGNLGF